MAATVYIVKTNGIESARMTSKVKAIARAEELSLVADGRMEGDVIQVVTEKTGKSVFEHAAERSYNLGEILGDEYIEHPDAFAHMGEQINARIIADGGCVGLCAIGTGCKHCDEQYGEIEPETASHALSFYVETEGKGTVYECTSCGSMGTKEELSVFSCEGGTEEPETDAESVCDDYEDAQREADDAYWAEQDAKDNPEEPETCAVMTVNVVQARPGMNGMNHYHKPGCRDIERECKRWGITPVHGNMGRYEFSFESVADIIRHEYSDCNEGDWEWMINHANSDFDGMRLMPCMGGEIPLGHADDGRMVYDGDNGGKSGSWTLEARAIVKRHQYADPCKSCGEPSYDYNTPKCSRCRRQEERDMTDPLSRMMFPGAASALAAFREANEPVMTDWERELMETGTVANTVPATREFLCYGENGKAVHLGECAQATGADGPCCSIEDDGTDADEPTHVTREYHLSVIVDETTGAEIDLGWITLTLPISDAHNAAAVAEAYGDVYGEGTPRHGWSSIIRVNDSADI